MTPVQRYNAVGHVRRHWTQLVYDTFTDTPAQALTSHTPEIGSGYVSIDGDWEISGSGNGIVPSSGSGLVFNNTELDRDQAIEATVFYGGPLSVGISARITGTTPSTRAGYILRASGSLEIIHLFRIDAGVETQLGPDVSFLVTSGMRWRLECIGSQLTGYFDYVPRISVVDTTYTNGKIGLAGSSVGIQINDLTGYSRRRAGDVGAP